MEEFIFEVEDFSKEQFDTFVESAKQLLESEEYSDCDDIDELAIIALYENDEFYENNGYTLPCDIVRSTEFLKKFLDEDEDEIKFLFDDYNIEENFDIIIEEIKKRIK